MSSVYLVRHGQAGTRDAYDSLSELGRRQARLLGEYFLEQGIEFSSAYSGSMMRQQQTAGEIGAAYAQSVVPFPELIVDDQWNEFDLTHVYRELAPLLCEADPEFRREYEEMRQLIEQSNGAANAEVHRRWRPCDTKMVETWIAGRFPYSGETWKQFRARITTRLLKLSTASRQANILISTSATPTGIMAGLALDISDTRIRQLAGVLYNSSYTVLRQTGERLHLFQFNAVPHLTASELRTHR